VRPALRIAFIALRLATLVLGLAAVVYGTASLTGGWLGTPPWYRLGTVTDEEIAAEPMTQEDIGDLIQGMEPLPFTSHGPSLVPSWEAERLRELARARLLRSRWAAWPGAAIVAAGLALAAFGAWPRRRRSSVT
jgi:hypothetical protein